MLVIWLLIVAIAFLLHDLLGPVWYWVLMFCLAFWGLVGWMAYIAYNRV